MKHPFPGTVPHGTKPSVVGPRGDGTGLVRLPHPGFTVSVFCVVNHFMGTAVLFMDDQFIHPFIPICPFHHQPPEGEVVTVFVHQFVGTIVVTVGHPDVGPFVSGQDHPFCPST